MKPSAKLIFVPALLLALAVAGCSGETPDAGAAASKVGKSASVSPGGTTGATAEATDPSASGLGAEAAAAEDPDEVAPPVAAPEPTGPGVEVPGYTPKVGSHRGPPPANAKVPTPPAPLESHPGDKDNFYVDTDDYVLWAKPSNHTEAEAEYRVVAFDAGGMQSVAFMKFVFADEASAKAFASTNKLLILSGKVVYYKGWLGANAQDKAGVLEIAKAEGKTGVYVSKP